MNKTTMKRLEDKSEEIAEQISAELEAGVRDNLREAIDMMGKSHDGAAKLTATVEFKIKADEELQVVVTWTAEGKLRAKSDPFGFNVPLNGQGTLPGMDVPAEDADEDGDAPLLPGAPKLLPAPGDVAEGEVAEAGGDEAGDAGEEA